MNMNELNTSALAYESLNWVAMTALPRDQGQSLRLHEPAHMDSSIDPITGRDIQDRSSRPHHDDGNLTVYFESDATQQSYLAMPFNHPYPKLPGTGSEDDDRGG
jgi:hypothetical protein